MKSFKKIVKLSTDNILASFDYELSRKKISEDKAEGFPYYLKEANKAGIDVNDWQEEELGWEKSYPIIAQVAFPYLQKNSIVCEVGPGTGRWSRYIAEKVTDGELYLVDHSPWMVNWLQEYFQPNPRIKVHLGDGYSLSFANSSYFDLTLSFGTFIALNLGIWRSYFYDFFRVLKPSSYAIFDYIDINTEKGWEHFETQSKNHGGNCYTYYTPEIVDKVLLSVGFEIVDRHYIPDKSNYTYIVVRKPSIHNHTEN